MSVSYKAVGWNDAKRTYDLAIGIFCGSYLAVFCGGTLALFPHATVETAIIRGLGSLAFLLLHGILAIGPLCRLQPAFLPLLYNRRHLGVAMFLVALGHGMFSVVQFHALGDRNPILSLLSPPGPGVPFQILGLLALLILFAMAATSHDFWLRQLTAPVWKRLHMLVYLAYGLVLAHVAWGALQTERSPILLGLVSLGVFGLSTLHLAAGHKGLSSDREVRQEMIPVCDVDEIAENRARIVCAGGERVAVFRYDGKLSAVSNVCQHQNGPLGEGAIVDGCITCPWHGYQYLPESGQSPPPFTEKLPTFRLAREGRLILLDPRPQPAGTYVEPLRIDPS